MKALVIGCGHMGTRRAKILHALGFELTLYDADLRIARALGLEIGTNVFIHIAGLESYQTDYDVALICTPPASHLQLAIQSAKNGMNVFIEKPLTDRWDEIGIKNLVETLQAKGRWGMMGNSYRFLPSLREFRRSFIDHDVIAADIWAGQHLADWHPGEAYRDSYTARIGVAYESLSHSFDLCNWLFGEIYSISALVGNSGALDIKSSDTATCLVRMRSGAAVTIHCDFLQRPRDFHIDVVCATPEDGTHHRWVFKPSEAEEMYVKEMEAMKRSLEIDLQPQPDIFQGIKIQELIETAIASSARGTWERSDDLWKQLAKRVEA